MSIFRKSIVGVFVFFICCSFLNKETDTINWDMLSEVQDSIPDIVEGDWRSIHPEPVQCLTQFKERCKYNKHLYKTHVSITTLDVTDSIALDMIPVLQEYISIFLGLELDSVNVLEGLKIPRKARRNINGEQQIQTGYVLYQILYPQLKKSDLASICITSHDLYQDEAWNFVFGEADALNRVSVASYARYELNIDYQKGLHRLMKVTTHELCHVVGLEHCQKYSCNMNGSNSLVESDVQPLHLCLECLQKLFYIRNINVRKRYQVLEEFYTEHQFDSEAKKLRLFLSKLN